MTVSLIMRVPGGICYAHGPYQEWNCPQHPKCISDPKHVEYMEQAGLSIAEMEKLIACYCVCHSPYSSCVYCEHCKGDNEVANFHRERDRLKREVVHQAKEFFGSPNRDDTKALLKATGDLLVHEHNLTK